MVCLQFFIFIILQILITINVVAINRVVTRDELRLEIIVNSKTLENGINVIQLETAVGAAMKSFEGGVGINVPRSRFLPVKKTSDLFLVMSNLYSLKNGSLTMSPQRMFPTTPLVKLGDNHFAKVKEFLTRFSDIPDILELDHLTVSGDVTFGRKVSLRVSKFYVVITVQIKKQKTLDCILPSI